MNRVPGFGWAGEIAGLVGAFITGLGLWAFAADLRLAGATAAILGVACVAFSWDRQRRIKRLAAELANAPANARHSTLSALTLLADRLKAVEHRLTLVHPVTGLATREPLIAEMAADMAASATPHLLAAIRFVDFDRLAAFDAAAANVALNKFARRLATAARPAHAIGQIDRDCFAIWFREADLDLAAAEFHSIVYVCGQEIPSDASVLTPTLEAGTVRSREADTDPAQLLIQVSACIARPEGSGRGALTVAHAVAPESARESFALEQDLAQAIAEEQLKMVFQPVVDLAVARLIGAEALLRWEHPTLGAISPARFIPVVEQIGLSERFGMWVLNAACREARSWKDAGLEGLKMAVNLSARQLSDPALSSKIERTLARHGLRPRDLELELTETAAMADATRTQALFAQLRASGISISIDDFGSGYSSMSYLMNLPFDKLKIDREFVTNVDCRRESRAICKALIELGRGLDLLVLAEGVENTREVESLRELGCEIFQGYFFSKPLSGADFIRQAKDPAWLARLVTVPNPQVARIIAEMSA